ncbi:unnamed protein product [Porites lobata]|uniref:UMOD/GP2/OIT3-like D8C domain-containing protein n=1 Tax=Porites lobata TaxID=104759 RepID=A0ABN8Q5B3_9CNID|nr:unnamed protein product [Porites lobata]
MGTFSRGCNSVTYRNFKNFNHDRFRHNISKTIYAFTEHFSTILPKLASEITSPIFMGTRVSVLPFFPLECLNYQAITTQNGRKNTYVSTTAICDNNLFGWHRFEAATGTKMPTSCVPNNRCNTHATGWLNGSHPTVAEGLVTRQVCFSYYDCCSWSINIQVRNCGDFYIYNFMGTPPEHPCHLRYCSTD